MPGPPVVLKPGQAPVNTKDPMVIVAAMKKAGDFTFTVVVTDDAGLVGTADFKVTVRQG